MTEIELYENKEVNKKIGKGLKFLRCCKKALI